MFGPALAFTLNGFFGDFYYDRCRTWRRTSVKECFCARQKGDFKKAITPEMLNSIFLEPPSIQVLFGEGWRAACVDVTSKAHRKFFSRHLRSFPLP